MISAVCIVGRGRMANAFARATTAHTHRYAFYRANGRLPRTRPIGVSPTLWVLGVTDSAIAETLARLLPAMTSGDAVVHLAGMLGPDVLAAARERGVAVGAVHPLVAVASRTRSPSLEGLVVSFEGDRACARAVREWLTPLDVSVVQLSGVDRVRYHAAAALLATGGVALAQAGAALFTGSTAKGLTPGVAARFAASLLRSVAHNVVATSPERALASPLLRGDTRTVERHLEAMRAVPEAAALYRAALAQVLSVLDHDPSVPEDVLTRARKVIATRG